MSGLDLLSLAFGGLGLLMFVLSPLAKQTSGYRKPLDQFGPASVFERDVSRHESAYNRNPRLAMIKGVSRLWSLPYFFSPSNCFEETLSIDRWVARDCIPPIQESTSSI